MTDIRARLISCATGLALLLGPLATAAHAVTFGFSNISNNSGIAPQVGAQLSVDVTSVAGAVSFAFTNNGSIASSITDIYFDDATPPLFTGTPGIVNISGVAFSPNATPPNLPGGNTVTPAFVAAFSADSNSGNPGVLANGVNNTGGDSVAIVLSLTSGSTFAGVLSAILAGTFRIGLHVQGIGDNGSASDAFISATPVPAALPLFVTGLVAMSLLRRRRKTVSSVAA